MRSLLSFEDASELLAAERELLEALHALYQEAPMPPEVRPLFDHVALAQERFGDRLRPLITASLGAARVEAERNRNQLRNPGRHLSLVK